MTLKIDRIKEDNIKIVINGKDFKAYRGFSSTADILKFAKAAVNGEDGEFRGAVPAAIAHAEDNQSDLGYDELTGDNLYTEDGKVVVETASGKDGFEPKDFASALIESITSDKLAWVIENYGSASEESISRQLANQKRTSDRIDRLVEEIKAALN